MRSTGGMKGVLLQMCQCIYSMQYGVNIPVPLGDAEEIPDMLCTHLNAIDILAIAKRPEICTNLPQPEGRHQKILHCHQWHQAII